MDRPPQFHPALDVLGAQRSRVRDGAHGLALLALWALFAWLWVRVVQTVDARDVAIVVGVVVASALVTLVVTIVWVRHNVSIARARGPRTGLPAAPLTYEEDWTGRPVDADWEAVRTAALVVVVDGRDRKRFLPQPLDAAATADGDEDPASIGARA